MRTLQQHSPYHYWELCKYGMLCSYVCTNKPYLLSYSKVFIKLHRKVPNRKRVFRHYMIMCDHNVHTVTDNVHNFNHRNCVLISFHFSTSNRFGLDDNISYMNLFNGYTRNHAIRSHIYN